MAIQRFISLINGIKTAVTAITAGGTTNEAGKIIATDADGKLDMSFMPVGIGSETDSIAADTGGVASGNVINLYNKAGTITARKADATAAGKQAHGFVLANITVGNPATIHRPGQTITGLTGLTEGSEYFLHTTAGAITADVSGFVAGNVIQSVGIAISATTLAFNPGEPITLA